MRIRTALYASFTIISVTLILVTAHAEVKSKEDNGKKAPPALEPIAELNETVPVKDASPVTTPSPEASKPSAIPVEKAQAIEPLEPLQESGHTELTPLPMDNGEPTKRPPQVITIDSTMRELKSGNRLYAREHYKLKKDSKKTNEPKPIALIISDIEPLSSPEKIFRQKEKMLFVIRTPGLIINDDVIDGINLATKAQHIKFIVVLGNGNSKLMQVACRGGYQESYPPILLAKLQPAIKAAKEELPQLTCNDPRLIEATVKHNMLNSVKSILLHSPFVKQSLANKSIQLVGAMKDPNTGEVSFYDPNNF